MLNVSCFEDTQCIYSEDSSHFLAMDIYYSNSKQKVIKLLKNTESIDDNFNWNKDVIEEVDNITEEEFYKEFELWFLDEIDLNEIAWNDWKDGYYIIITRGYADLYYLKFKKDVLVKSGRKYLYIDKCWKCLI